MKIITKLFSLTMAILILCGCGNSSVNNFQPTTEETVCEYNLLPLSARLPRYANVSVNDNNGIPDIFVSLPYSSKTQSIMDDFGVSVYRSLSYCRENFEEFKVSVSIWEQDGIPLLWVSSISEWGALIDKRSGETKTTVFDTVDDFCAVFPTVNEEVNLDLLEEQDRKIYLEVIAELDSRPNDSEETILSELSPKYGLTSQQLYIFIKDVSQKVYSMSHVFDAKTPITYPKCTESPLFRYFKTAPEIIFSTPASENGLGKKIYSVVGTVREYGTLELDGFEWDYFIIDTECGSVLFQNTYQYALELGKESGENLTEELSDYTFPAISDNVKVYGVYLGFSNKFSMPSFIYGIPKFIESN